MRSIRSLFALALLFVAHAAVAEVLPVRAVAIAPDLLAPLPMVIGTTGEVLPPPKTVPPPPEPQVREIHKREIAARIANLLQGLAQIARNGH